MRPGECGGLFNTGTVTLVQSLLSGNTATVNGPEAYSVSGPSGPSTVITDAFTFSGMTADRGFGVFVGREWSVAPDAAP